jgi:HAD superfamily hydrolase (TIGR01484 family)
MEPQANFSDIGSIALDIDGTLTTSEHELPLPIKKYLENCVHEGWHLVFLTGRTYSFAWHVIGSLRVPFELAVQNGASIHALPSEKLLLKRYLTLPLLEQLEAIFHEEKMGFLIESGKANADFCYFKPANFSEEMLTYLQYRKRISGSEWTELTNWSEIACQDFAVAKFFGTLEQCQKIAKRIPFAKVTIIRDVFRTGFYLAHINALGAGKKEAVEFLCKKRPLIAAGDDFNDLEMLKFADVAVVPKNAAKPIQEVGDVLGYDVDQIVEALKEAKKRL